jgi:hypothetical protein
MDAYITDIKSTYIDTSHTDFNTSYTNASPTDPITPYYMLSLLVLIRPI